MSVWSATTRSRGSSSSKPDREWRAGSRHGRRAKWPPARAGPETARHSDLAQNLRRSNRISCRSWRWWSESWVIMTVMMTGRPWPHAGPRCHPGRAGVPDTDDPAPFPGGLAGDDRGNDAPIEPADPAAVRRGKPGPGSAQRRAGALPGRVLRGLVRVCAGGPAWRMPALHAVVARWAWLAERP